MSSAEPSVPSETPAALVVLMGYSAIGESEFSGWYRQEHIPERMRLPGFHELDRWFDPERSLSLAWYGLGSIQALNTPEYQAVYGAHFSEWTKRIVAAADVNRRYTGVAIYAHRLGRDRADRSALALIEWPRRCDVAADRGWAEALPATALTSIGALDAHVYRVVDGPADHVAVLGLYGPVPEPEVIATVVPDATVTLLTTRDAVVRGGPRALEPHELDPSSEHVNVTENREAHSWRR